MRYKIAVCDDSATDSEYIKELISAWAEKRNITLQINTFPSAEAFLFHYADEKDYNIFLLDIEMKAINGVELAKRIRTENGTAQIVFITGFSDFIAEGYEVSALHYLMKPVSAYKLSEVLDRAVANLGKNEKSIIISTAGKSVRLAEGDIVSVEAFAHSCVVTTIHEKLEVKSSITEMQKLLGNSFIRCHRSYLVSIRFIKSISKAEITLDSGAKLPLSRSNYDAVNQAFIRYFKGDM